MAISQNIVFPFLRVVWTQLEKYQYTSSLRASSPVRDYLWDSHCNYKKLWKTFAWVATLTLMLQKLILIETTGLTRNILPNILWHLPLKKILRNFCVHLIIQHNLLLCLLTFNSSDKKYKNNNWYLLIP